MMFCSVVACCRLWDKGCKLHLWSRLASTPSTNGLSGDKSCNTKIYTQVCFLTMQFSIMKIPRWTALKGERKKKTFKNVTTSRSSQFPNLLIVNCKFAWLLFFLTRAPSAFMPYYKAPGLKSLCFIPDPTQCTKATADMPDCMKAFFVEIAEEGCATKGREQSIAGEERLLDNISKCFPNPANPSPQDLSSPQGRLCKCSKTPLPARLTLQLADTQCPTGKAIMKTLLSV